MRNGHETKEDAMRTATTVLMGMLLLGLLAGCAPKSLDETATLADLAIPGEGDGPNLSPEQHQRIGDRLAAEGRGEAAFLHYQKALAELELTGAPQDDPRRLDLRARKGLLLLADNQTDAALTEFQEVLAASPDHAGANEGAGAVYLRTGLLKEAREHLERAVAADPKLWRTHQLLGVLDSREGDLDASLRELNASLELAPNRAGTLNNLGVTLLMRREYGPALDAFRKALLAGAPKDRIYNNIGLTLARMGRRQEALEAFKYAGGEASAYNNLGYVLLLQGEVDDAASCFEKAVELSPSYYAKAFENLKQARMARGFLASGLAATRPDPVPAPASGGGAAPAPQDEDSATHPALLADPEKEPVSALPMHFEPAPPAQQARAATASLRPAQDAPAAEPGKTPGQARVYGFHVASFRTRAVAEGEAARLAPSGLDISVARVELPEKGVWYRVMAGRYASLDQARARRAAAAAALGQPDTEELFIKSFENPEQATPPAHRVL
jgi:Flp pilus assembly protein TadD